MNSEVEARQSEFRKEALQIDKADLMALLEMRFGRLPDEITQQIEAMTDAAAVERLILVAANVPDWKSMFQELVTAGSTFGIVGEAFNPVSEATRGGC